MTDNDADALYWVLGDAANEASARTAMSYGCSLHEEYTDDNGKAVKVFMVRKEGFHKPLHH